MEIGFALFALLPLGLASFFQRDRRGTFAGIGFLAALAPVVASGIGSLVKHKQKQSAEKKAIEFERQQAAAQEAARRSEFESAQGSPGALAQRQKFTLQLGKLLGAAGGREKVPPSILNYLESQRKPQAYTPGAAHVPRPTSGAGFWDFASGLGEALSYLDTSRLGGGSSRGRNVGGIIDPTYRTGQVREQFALAPRNQAANPAALAVPSLGRIPFENVLSPGQPIRRPLGRL